MRFSIGLLMVVCIVTTLGAQSYKWDNVAIGGGGFVSGIVTSKTQPNLMYARTDVGGAYRWNATTSSWIPLLDWNSENQKGYQGVEAIALDPSASNVVYMLIGTSYFNGGATAIIRSTDYGNSFTVTDVTSQFKAHGNGMGRQNGERLAVDPNRGNILFCGTRYNGLFKSTTSGTSWTNVTTVGNSTANGNGIAFVVFDPSTGTPGNATQTLVFGVSQIGTNMYISNDGGNTFNAISGAPTNLMPQRAVLTSNRDLIITYANAEGPWNISSGQIWKYSLSSGTWTNLTPAGYTFGFGGISVDPNNANRMIATSMNVYWNQYGTVYGDRIFLSTNGGTNWTDIVAGGITLDNNGIGWINGNSIHWAGCIEFNPFNTNQAHVISGNGLFTNDNVNTSKTWRFNVKELEETVPLDVISIPNGPFVSVIGDYDGFVHPDVTQYPPNRHNPSMGSTNSVAYAGSNTNFIVRLGSSMYYSTNQGSTWTKTTNLNGSNGRVGVSANGATLFHCPDAS
ncbi:MAG: hypothetical protein K2Q22_03890, partial [Cytophagales bacterium]|nr:hypothetical protein [Cytophagales bacterium]